MNRYNSILLSGLLTLFFPGGLPACEVPVFRYALERWPTEKYLLEIDTAYGSVPNLNSTVNYLKIYTQESGSIVNIELKLKHDNTPAKAAAVLSYPLPNGNAIEIWSGEWTGQTTKRIVDSPLRRELAARLGEGQNAVWVVLLSGDSGRDKAALEILESTILELEGSLSLPEAVGEIDGEGLPELRVDFSLLRLSRDDSEEEILARMLIASEPDLGNYSGRPIAFPVFGRGRVLYALVGDGITPGNIRDACAFLVGPCACEIKDLSPGMDLLITADWAQLAGKSWVDRINGGPLTSLASITGISRRDSSPGMANGKRSTGPVLSILAALAVIIVVVMVVSFRIVKSSKTRD